MLKPWDDPQPEPDFWDEVDKAYDHMREEEAARYFEQLEQLEQLEK